MKKIYGVTHCAMCGRRMAQDHGVMNSGMGPKCLGTYLRYDLRFRALAHNALILAKARRELAKNVVPAEPYQFEQLVA